MKPIIYKKAAVRTLRRMDRKTATRIIAKIEAFAVDLDHVSHDVKPLKDRDAIRLRVGDWRVIMRDNTVLAVLAIGSRGDIYKK